MIVQAKGTLGVQSFFPSVLDGDDFRAAQIVGNDLDNAKTESRFSDPDAEPT